MKIDQDMLNDALDGAKESLKQSLIKEMEHSLTWNIKNALGEEIKNHVTEWCKDNIIPDINAELTHGKDNIIKSISSKLSKQVGEKIQEAMIEELTKKLETSWGRAKVLEALFKS